MMSMSRTNVLLPRLALMVVLVACSSGCGAENARDDDPGRIEQADDPVIVELARRSRVPAEALRGIVANCTLNQRNMNLCAFRDLVDVEQKLAWHVAHLSERLTVDERHALDLEQAAWAKDAEVRCNAEADDEAEGGSMRPMVFSGCLARETQARIDALGQAGSPGAESPIR